jgi:NAD(P)H-dependent flavin oxidoreductase YrpB (nitropropane dioxygenase family)
MNHAESLLDGMPRLIQAGMGIHVSSARLANETSRLGALGVVSHVALRHIVVEEVRRGDAIALALAREFPIPCYADELLAFAPGGEWHKRPVPLDVPAPEKSLLPKRLSTIAAFIEVKRAKLGHSGKVGINVMWKCSLTVLPSIYGAMLAGVDALLCGAGIPMELPDIVRKIRAGEDLCYSPLHGTGTPASLAIAADKSSGFLAQFAEPKLMPILSSFPIAKRLLDVWTREFGTKPFAFILENHTAGGHNAPPRNKTEYTDADELMGYFDKVHALGVPIYVAGAFPEGGSHNDFLYWRERGAYGLQVGSRFALCDESGMRRELKDEVLAYNALGGELETAFGISPTGYPFKVLPLPGSAADPSVHEQRRRICNKGYLMQAETIERDGAEELVFRCPAMPSRQYEKLGGDSAEIGPRICLCNSLLSTAGFDSEKEAPLITLGISGKRITERHSAREVIEDILGQVEAV